MTKSDKITETAQTAPRFDLQKALNDFFSHVPANTSPEIIKAAVDAIIAAHKA